MQLPAASSVFTAPAAAVISTLSLHDALPIYYPLWLLRSLVALLCVANTINIGADLGAMGDALGLDRKSTRLNSSHVEISYAVFCLKKKTSDQHRDHVYTLVCCTTIGTASDVS